MFWQTLLINIITSIIVTAVISFSILGKNWIKIQLGRYGLNRRIYKAGISNIYISRDDFAKYRNFPKIAPKFLDYLKLAKNNIYIVVYWMAYGTEIEGIPKEIINLVKPPYNLNITICVIDPKTSCMDALSKHTNMAVSDLTDRMTASLNTLKEEKDKLSQEEKNKLVIKTYDSLPLASVIMLDYGYEYGRMQVEFKPYHIAPQYSFSFEFCGVDNDLYKLLSEAYIDQIADASEFN